MNLTKHLKTIALAAFGVILATSATLAAQATTSLNVRGGPNTSYGVVDVLYPGEYVNVKTCHTNGWCYITHRGPDGWVSSNYLADSYRTFNKKIVRSRPQVRRVVPQTGVTIQFGTTGFGWSIVGGAPDCIRRFGKIYCR